MNIVIYNKTKNKAWYAYVNANTGEVVTTFSGLTSGEYYIGFYESMFYDIVSDNHVNYRVGEDGTVTNLEVNGNSNYGIAINNSNRGLIISVIVTKQYENWLYCTGSM